MGALPLSLVAMAIWLVVVQSYGLDIAKMVARTWVWIYTCMPVGRTARDRRRAEMRSDLWETISDLRDQQRLAPDVVALRVLVTTLRGAPSDVGWAFDVLLRRGFPVSRFSIGMLGIAVVVRTWLGPSMLPPGNIVSWALLGLIIATMFLPVVAGVNDMETMQQRQFVRAVEQRLGVPSMMMGVIDYEMGNAILIVASMSLWSFAGALIWYRGGGLLSPRITRRQVSSVVSELLHSEYRLSSGSESSESEVHDWICRALEPYYVTRPWSRLALAEIVIAAGALGLAGYAQMHAGRGWSALALAAATLVMAGVAVGHELVLSRWRSMRERLLASLWQTNEG